MSGTPRCCNTLRSTPLGNLDPVIRLFEGIFLTASANLIRNREFHVDYLGHAHGVPRLRFSVRSMMVAVVIVALVLYGRRVQQHRLNLVVLCGIADRGVRHSGASYRLD